MSAHVVPKVPAFSTDDEDEKTTIESGGWEEEASTTVEQGDVAERVRALGRAADPPRPNTNITSTNGGGVSDEPTVDDQRANAALAMLPPPSVARLVVTEGNDAGRLLEVRPGKTYTIGRGIDNDLVLTDIAVSRKHFDLRHENGAWVVADRGSGNGTLINHRIEDAPFMLASGDAIEVGKTAFRFELVASPLALPGIPVPDGARDAAGPHAGERGPGATREPGEARELARPVVGGAAASRELVVPAVSRDALAAAGLGEAAGGRDLASGIPLAVATYDGSIVDDLELSAVASKPLDAAAPVASRPKTLPPPAMLPRPRSPTGRPAVGYAQDRAGARSQQMIAPSPPMAPGAIAAAMTSAIAPVHGAPLVPVTSLPLPQVAGRGPILPGVLREPAMGTMSPPGQVAQMGGAMGQMGAMGQVGAMSPLPATLPGQGPPGSAGRNPRLPFAYPSAPELASHYAPDSVRSAMTVAASHAGREAPATAQVPRMTYSGTQAVVTARPAPRIVAELSRRMKLVAGGIGLAAVAAIAAIAIGKGPASDGALVDPRSDLPVLSPPPGRMPTVAAGSAAAPEPIRPSVTPIAEPSAPRNPGAPAPSAPQPGTAPARLAAAGPTTSPPASPALPPAPAPVRAATEPAGAAIGAPPAPAPVGPAGAPTGSAAALTAKAEPASPAAPASPVRSEAAGNARKAIKQPEPRKPEKPEKRDRPEKPDRPEKFERPDKSDRGDKKLAESAPSASARSEKKAAELSASPSAKPDKKHGGRSLQDLKAEAAGLYRQKNFSGAAALLTSSLSGLSSDDVKELKNIAAIYTQLGKAYNIGMAPGTKASEAYQELRHALEFDRDAGSAYVAELQGKLVVTASRAASSYMAAREYERAFQAVRTAESLGSTSENNKVVRSLLEDAAADLLRTAQGELSSAPDDAKQKLRQILGMVDARNSLYGRAQKLLGGL